MKSCMDSSSRVQLSGKVFCKRTEQLKESGLNVVILQEQIESAFRVQAMS